MLKGNFCRKLGNYDLLRIAKNIAKLQNAWFCFLKHWFKIININSEIMFYITKVNVMIFYLKTSYIDNYNKF